VILTIIIIILLLILIIIIIIIYNDAYKNVSIINHMQLKCNMFSLV